MLHLAWRNIWRNKRRTIFSISSFAAGIAILIFNYGFADAFMADMIRQATESSMGQMQISAKGYRETRDATMTIPNADETLAIVEAYERIVGASPHIYGTALALTSENNHLVQIIGLDPDREKQVTQIANQVKEGEFLPKLKQKKKRRKKKGVVIGHRLAKHLKVKIGSKLTLRAKNPERFKVVGIFRSGSDFTDKSIVYLNLKDAQDLFGREGGVHEIILKMNNLENLDSAAAHLSSQMQQPDAIEILPWYKANQLLGLMVDMMESYSIFFILLVGIIAASSILNASFTSIFERRYEFGVMLSIGLKPRGLVRMIMTEAFIINILGVAFGVLLGVLLNAYFNEYGIDLRGYMETFEFAGISFENMYRAKTTLRGILYPAIGLTIIGVIVSLYPAMKVAKLKPIEAMRRK